MPLKDSLASPGLCIPHAHSVVARARHDLGPFVSDKLHALDVCGVPREHFPRGVGHDERRIVMQQPATRSDVMENATVRQHTVTAELNILHGKARKTKCSKRNMWAFRLRFSRKHSTRAYVSIFGSILGW